MAKYAAQRLLMVPFILMLISLLVFFAIRLAPGDPAEMAMQQFATEEELARLRAEWGLDQPLWQQYLRFVWNALQGDFGRSFFGNVSVGEQVAQRLPATIELAVAAVGVSAVIGVVAGTLAAVHRGKWIDQLSRLIALFGISMPIFWLGLMLIALFAVTLGWLPVSGRLDARTFVEAKTHFIFIDALLAGDFRAFGSAALHLVLPAVTMGLYSAGIVARFTRSAMLEVLNQDYIRTARSKGLRERVVVYSHALRNAMLPVITILGLQFGNFLGGAAVTETVFSWPGLGKLLIDAILQRDYPQVQASVFVLATTYVLVNLAVDLAYAKVDPRISYA
jgi:peptide/nickel transport system permease protein